MVKRGSSKNSDNQKSYLSPTKAFELKQLQIERRQAKQEQELRDLRHKQTKSGRVSSFIQRFAQHRAQQQSYGKQFQRKRPVRIAQPYPYNESTIIPDTRGTVPLGHIHQEIDDAANAFP